MSRTPGHRELTNDEAALVQDVRDQGEALRGLLERIEGLPGRDLRWLALSRTYLQTGMMMAVRAVTRPEFF